MMRYDNIDSEKFLHILFNKNFLLFTHNGNYKNAHTKSFAFRGFFDAKFKEKKKRERFETTITFTFLKPEKEVQKMFDEGIDVDTIFKTCFKIT